MRRRRPQGEEAKPSLFPFLDVMLCTIGTLIVLLLVIVFHAWKHAETTVEAAPEPTHAAKEDDPATWRNRVAQLRSTQRARSRDGGSALARVASSSARPACSTATHAAMAAPTPSAATTAAAP